MTIRPIQLPCLVCLFVLLLASSSYSGEIKKELLVGKWEFVEGPPNAKDGPPKGMVIEFTKDGKVLMSAKIGDKDIKKEGVYKVEGNKLTITDAGGKSNEKPVTIKTLTQAELVVEEMNGKSIKLKRKT